jgi:hypothetical protein
MLVQLMDSDFFFLIYLLILIVMLLAGIALSRWLGIAPGEGESKNSLLNAIISFFSLLLAFTLSSSADSNKQRISFIQQHRGSIASLYRQSFLFDDSLRLSVKQYAINSIELKLAAMNTHSADTINELDRRATLLNNTYLRAVSALTRDHPQSHTGARTIADEINKVIYLDAQVHYSNQQRTPSVVMLLLLIVSWTIAFAMGLFGTLYRKRHYLGPIIFTFLTSLTVLIIQDMDNPHQGIIRPPYDIYRGLLDEIKEE